MKINFPPTTNQKGKRMIMLMLALLSAASALDVYTEVPSSMVQHTQDSFVTFYMPELYTKYDLDGRMVVPDEFVSFGEITELGKVRDLLKAQVNRVVGGRRNAVHPNWPLFNHFTYMLDRMEDNLDEMINTLRLDDYFKKDHVIQKRFLGGFLSSFACSSALSAVMSCGDDHSAIKKSIEELQDSVEFLQNATDILQTQQDTDRAYFQGELDRLETRVTVLQSNLLNVTDTIEIQNAWFIVTITTISSLEVTVRGRIRSELDNLKRLQRLEKASLGEKIAPNDIRHSLIEYVIQTLKPLCNEENDFRFCPMYQTEFADYAQSLVKSVIVQINWEDESIMEKIWYPLSKTMEWYMIYKPKPFCVDFDGICKCTLDDVINTRLLVRTNVFGSSHELLYTQNSDLLLCNSPSNSMMMCDQSVMDRARAMSSQLWTKTKPYPAVSVIQNEWYQTKMGGDCNSEPVTHVGDLNWLFLRSGVIQVHDSYSGSVSFTRNVHPGTVGTIPCSKWFTFQNQTFRSAVACDTTTEFTTAEIGIADMEYDPSIAYEVQSQKIAAKVDEFKQNVTDREAYYNVSKLNSDGYNYNMEQSRISLEASRDALDGAGDGDSDWDTNLIVLYCLVIILYIVVAYSLFQSQSAGKLADVETVRRPLSWSKTRGRNKEDIKGHRQEKDHTKEAYWGSKEEHSKYVSVTLAGKTVTTWYISFLPLCLFATAQAQSLDIGDVAQGVVEALVNDTWSILTSEQKAILIVAVSVICLATVSSTLTLLIICHAKCRGKFAEADVVIRNEMVNTTAIALCTVGLKSKWSSGGIISLKWGFMLIIVSNLLMSTYACSPADCTTVTQPGCVPYYRCQSGTSLTEGTVKCKDTPKCLLDCTVTQEEGCMPIYTCGNNTNTDVTLSLLGYKGSKVCWKEEVPFITWSSKIKIDIGLVIMAGFSIVAVFATLGVRNSWRKVKSAAREVPLPMVRKDEHKSFYHDTSKHFSKAYAADCTVTSMSFSPVAVVATAYSSSMNSVQYLIDLPDWSVTAFTNQVNGGELKNSVDVLKMTQSLGWTQAANLQMHGAARMRHNTEYQLKTPTGTVTRMYCSRQQGSVSSILYKGLADDDIVLIQPTEGTTKRVQTVVTPGPTVGIGTTELQEEQLTTSQDFFIIKSVVSAVALLSGKPIILALLLALARVNAAEFPIYSVTQGAGTTIMEPQDLVGIWGEYTPLGYVYTQTCGDVNSRGLENLTEAYGVLNTNHVLLGLVTAAEVTSRFVTCVQDRPAGRMKDGSPHLPFPRWVCPCTEFGDELCAAYDPYHAVSGHEDKTVYYKTGLPACVEISGLTKLEDDNYEIVDISTGIVFETRRLSGYYRLSDNYELRSDHCTATGSNEMFGPYLDVNLLDEDMPATNMVGTVEQETLIVHDHGELEVYNHYYDLNWKAAYLWRNFTESWFNAPKTFWCAWWVRELDIVIKMTYRNQKKLYDIMMDPGSVVNETCVYTHSINDDGVPSLITTTICHSGVRRRLLSIIEEPQEAPDNEAMEVWSIITSAVLSSIAIMTALFLIENVTKESEVLYVAPFITLTCVVAISSILRRMPKINWLISVLQMAVTVTVPAVMCMSISTDTPLLVLIGANYLCIIMAVVTTANCKCNVPGRTGNVSIIRIPRLPIKPEVYEAGMIENSRVFMTQNPILDSDVSFSTDDNSPARIYDNMTSGEYEQPEPSAPIERTSKCADGTTVALILLILICAIISVAWCFFKKTGSNPPPMVYKSPSTGILAWVKEQIFWRDPRALSILAIEVEMAVITDGGWGGESGVRREKRYIAVGKSPKARNDCANESTSGFNLLLRVAKHKWSLGTGASKSPSDVIMAGTPAEYRVVDLKKKWGLTGFTVAIIQAATVMMDKTGSCVNHNSNIEVSYGDDSGGIRDTRTDLEVLAESLAAKLNINQPKSNGTTNYYTNFTQSGKVPDLTADEKVYMEDWYHSEHSGKGKLDMKSSNVLYAAATLLNSSRTDGILYMKDWKNITHESLSMRTQSNQTATTGWQADADVEYISMVSVCVMLLALRLVIGCLPGWDVMIRPVPYVLITVAWIWAITIIPHPLCYAAYAVCVYMLYQIPEEDSVKSLYATWSIGNIRTLPFDLMSGIVLSCVDYMPNPDKPMLVVPHNDSDRTRLREVSECYTLYGCTEIGITHELNHLKYTGKELIACLCTVFISLWNPIAAYIMKCALDTVVEVSCDGRDIAFADVESIPASHRVFDYTKHCTCPTTICSKNIQTNGWTSLRGSTDEVLHRRCAERLIQYLVYRFCCGSKGKLEQVADPELCMACMKLARMTGGMVDMPSISSIDRITNLASSTKVKSIQLDDYRLMRIHREVKQRENGHVFGETPFKTVLFNGGRALVGPHMAPFSHVVNRNLSYVSPSRDDGVKLLQQQSSVSVDDIKLAEAWIL